MRLPRLRGARLALAVGVGVLLVIAVAIAASAALDRPAKVVNSEVTVDAPVETVWQILTDFDEYRRWNPVITSAAGQHGLGGELHVSLEPPDGRAEELDPEIVIWRPNRKLRWQARQGLPGVADREYEVILEQLDDGRVRVFQQTRLEGVLIPFRSTDEEKVGLDLMGRALKERAEATTPGTTIRTTEPWTCNRPLEDYGPLPVIVKSRIDNAAAQPDPVVAVTLDGPDCAGDGDPETVDLVLEIEGDGADVGPTADAVRVKLGAHDVEVTGYANCGAPAEGASQKGVHVMLGYRITFLDFAIGDPASRSWTCDGTWGALAIEERSAADPEPEDVVCVRCRIVSDGRSLHIGDSVRSGARESVFVSRERARVEEGAEEPVDEGNTWERLPPDGEL